MIEKGLILPELEKDLFVLHNFNDEMGGFITYIGIDSVAAQTLLSLYDLYIKSFVWKYGETIQDWMEYFIYECDFGKTPMEVINHEKKWLFDSIESFVNYIKTYELGE